MMMREIYFLRLLIFITFLFGFINVCIGNEMKNSLEDNREETGEGNDDGKDESMDIPMESDVANNSVTCTRRTNSRMHEIQTAQSKQFPFVAAVMSQQNDYLCAGSVVSNGLVLTTAHCVRQPVSHLLLNASKDKRDDTTVKLQVIKSDQFPTFTGSDAMNDVGLLYTERYNASVASKIRISNYTSSRNLVDAEAIGFGLNAEVGAPKDLQYIGMEVRKSPLGQELLVGYFDCVETKVVTCFKDTGGPVIFDNELIGIVIKGQEECTKEMSATYAINKKIADVLPCYTFKAWLDERIKKHEEQEEAELPTYPALPARRAVGDQPTKIKKNVTAIKTVGRSKLGSGCNVKSSVHILLIFYPILLIT